MSIEDRVRRLEEKIGVEEPSILVLQRGEDPPSDAPPNMIAIVTGVPRPLCPYREGI